MLERDGTRLGIESFIEHLRESFEKIPRQAHHFSPKIIDIDTLAMDPIDQTSGDSSMLPLSSIIDSLERLSTKDSESLLQIAMELLSGFPVPVVIPSNAQSLTAWDSHPSSSLSLNRVNFAGFSGMIERNRGLASSSHPKVVYNAFLALPEPNDGLAELVYYLASGTQVLNWLTGAALGMNEYNRI